MKKLLLILLAALMCISVCACGGEEANQPEETQANNSSEVSEETKSYYKDTEILTFDCVVEGAALVKEGDGVNFYGSWDDAEVRDAAIFAYADYLESIGCTVTKSVAGCTVETKYGSMMVVAGELDGKSCVGVSIPK